MAQDVIHPTLENAVRVQGLICTSDKEHVEIPTNRLLMLLIALVSHPFVLESTCSDCEMIQNALDDMLDEVKL